MPALIGQPMLIASVASCQAFGGSNIIDAFNSATLDPAWVILGTSVNIAQSNTAGKYQLLASALASDHDHRYRSDRPYAGAFNIFVSDVEVSGLTGSAGEVILYMRDIVTGNHVNIKFLKLNDDLYIKSIKSGGIEIGSFLIGSFITGDNAKFQLIGNATRSSVQVIYNLGAGDVTLFSGDLSATLNGITLHPSFVGGGGFQSGTKALFEDLREG